MVNLRMQSLKLKLVLGAVFLGFLITLTTGFFRNEKGVSIPEIKRYGYPLLWLITNLNGPTEYIVANFVLDVIFWTTIFLIVLLLAGKVLAKL